jgi:hypothetical protein
MPLSQANLRHGSRVWLGGGGGWVKKQVLRLCLNEAKEETHCCAAFYFPVLFCIFRVDDMI